MVEAIRGDGGSVAKAFLERFFACESSGRLPDSAIIQNVAGTEQHQRDAENFEP